MAATAQSDDDDEIRGINVTPFVDIALVLLIIFMVTAKYIVSQSLPVDLPQASTATATPSPTLSLTIDRTGQFYLDATSMTEPQLTEALRDRFARDPDVRAVISADRTIQHGRFVRMVDIVRAVGISHFAIETETETPATSR